jgi:curli biogenesis system outer membrane secretion channel CsgG
MGHVSRALRLFPLMLLAAALGCASGPAPVSARGGYPHSQRFIIAVLDVENRAGGENAAEIIQRSTSLLIEELLTTNRVRIVEREKLGLILEELKMGMSGLVDARQAKRVGNLLGVDALMYAVLESATTEDNKRSAGIAYSLKRKTEVGMSARLVHVETGEILASAEVTEKVTQRKNVAFGFITSGNLAKESTALGAAVEEATRQLARALAARVPSKS